MNKPILIGMTAIALTLGACGRKRTPPAEIPPVEQPPAADPNSTDPNSLEVVELPALQADLVAKAGSDTVYFGTDEYSLDEAIAGHAGRAGALAARQPQCPRVDRRSCRRARHARI